MRRRHLLIAAIALVVALAAAAAIVVIGTSRNTESTSVGPVAAGETIFRTGTFAGQVIPRTGGFGSGMMGAAMMGESCASCHGPNGGGSSTSAFTAPNITYANLTKAQGMIEPDGSRGAQYTAAGLRKAITEGIDPSGSRLEAIMPRWQLSDQEWTDLLAYLKTLH